MAVAMNGAVHGVAATVASAPVKNDPAKPARPASDWPTPVQRPPRTITPDRPSAITNSTSASRVTKTGDWSWKPQPICWPPARRPSSAPATTANETSTPAV